MDESQLVCAIPILVKLNNEPIELMVAFVAAEGRNNLPPEARNYAIPLYDEDGVEFLNAKSENPVDVWAVPCVIKARRIIGPLQDNIPGGDGGEIVEPKELHELMDEVDFDFIELLDSFKHQLVEDCSVAKIISRFVIQNRGY
jgi:hypothetical protein